MALNLALEAPIGLLTVKVRCNRGSDAFIFSEVFEHRYYDFNLPQAPRTILDLGANIGFTALFFARTYPNASLACVEPMAENLVLLKANMKLNGISAHVVPKAIAVEDGTVTMLRVDMDYGHKINDMEFGRQLTGDTVEVPSISVPSLMRELGWGRIGLLKIDVEGYEGILLRTNCDWLFDVDAICIECHEGFSINDLSEVAKLYKFSPPVPLPGMILMMREA